MPAVLVECGFMSNSADREALITEKGRDRIASDIYDAFRKYKKEYDGTDAAKTSSQPQQVKENEAKGVDRNSANAQTMTKDDNPIVTEDKSDKILYGTQVLVSSKTKEKNGRFFKGHDVMRLQYGRLYKYIIGFSEDLDTAQKKHDKIRMDFKDSFMVKIENGTSERMR